MYILILRLKLATQKHYILSLQSDYRFCFGLCYDRVYTKRPILLYVDGRLCYVVICYAKHWRHSINGHSYTYRFRLMRTMHLKKIITTCAVSLMRGYDRFNLVYIYSEWLVVVPHIHICPL